MAMKSELDRIELGEIARCEIAMPGIIGFASGHFWGWSRNVRTGYLGLVWVPVVLIAGLGAWVLVPGHASKPAESELVPMEASVATEPQPAVVGTPLARAMLAKDPSFNLATSEAIAPEQPAPLDGLKISSQSWRRGGLGSKALVTFTLRNSNDYAVADIEISCAFARRDGRHLTDRTRLIHDTVNMRSRKTFARMHVGFVNVNAAGAKCTLVAANRI
jgi:hypothetical protein